MQQQIFQNYDEDMRRQMLEDNASKVTMGHYTRKFSHGEKQQRQKRNAEIDIQLAEIREELAAFKLQIKNRMDPLQEEKNKLLDEIKSNGQYVEGKLYKIVDRDAKEVGLYDEDGNLVEQRRMTKEDNEISFGDAVMHAAAM